MAICIAPLSTSFSGSGCQLKAREVLWSSANGNGSFKAKVQTQRKHIHLRTGRNFTVRAEYSDDSRRGGGGADFVAGFVLGGAVFGTLAYVFAPQVLPYLTLLSFSIHHVLLVFIIFIYLNIRFLTHGCQSIYFTPA
ncbi:hypothetical protein ACFX19_042997 [Malus domestica]